MEIKLEFCVVWNYTPRAVGTIEDILEVYGNKVTNIQLIPSGGGVFEFHLNEKLLFSKKAGIKARYLHQGMTSSDVLDTSFNIQLVQSGKIILKDLDQFLKVLKKCI